MSVFFYINTFEFDRRIPDFIGDLTLTRPRCTLDRRVQPNSRKLLHSGGITGYLRIYLFLKKVAVFGFCGFCGFCGICGFCGDHIFPVNFFFQRFCGTSVATTKPQKPRSKVIYFFKTENL